MLKLEIDSTYVLTLNTPFIGTNGVEYRAVCGTIHKVSKSDITEYEITIGSLSFSSYDLKYAIKCPNSYRPSLGNIQTIYFT